MSVTVTAGYTADDLNYADTNCSLREAIEIANEDDDTGNETDCPLDDTVGRPDNADIVILPPSVIPYTRSIPQAAPADEDANLTGDFDVAGDAGDTPTTIMGSDPANPSVIVASDDLNPSRVFDVIGAEMELILKNVGITTTEGGSLPAGQYGGVIDANQADQKLTLQNVRINADDANADAVEAEQGGAIAFTASGAGGDILIEDSVITGGDASIRGGGLYLDNVDAGGTATVERSIIRGNKVTGAVGSSPYGGGISSSSGQLTIVDSEIDGNGATNSVGFNPIGGGVYFGGGSLTVRRSLIANNTISGAPAAINFEYGGGIAAFSGSFLMVNSTVFENTAGATGGPINAAGGGIAVGTDTATINHVTFADNDAADGGYGNDFFAFVDGLDFKGSILASGTPADPNGCDHEGGVSSLGYNVVFNGSDPECPDDGPGDTNVDPGLATALVGNGLAIGGTGGSLLRTLPIPETSIAANLVPVAQCGGAEGEDQRGVDRPIGPGCSAGAFEAACTTPAPFVGCPPLPPATLPTPTPAAGPTGLRAAALKKCKKKKKGKKRKKCKKKANKVPA